MARSRYGSRYDNQWGEYISVGQRAETAVKHAEKKLGKKNVQPAAKGRLKCNNFWGKAWLKHIRNLGDFEGRLTRGSAIAGNGTIAHLAITKGRIDAIVGGSEVYDISVDIVPLSRKRWNAIKEKSRGEIGSVVELLQGKFSDAVMQSLVDVKTGLFPDSNEFDLGCSCPDYVRLCKHLAGVLFAVGMRLDEKPELLFTLRGVDASELIETAADVRIASSTTDARTLNESDIAGVFGIEMQAEPAASFESSKKTPRTPKTKAKEQTAKKAKTTTKANKKPSSTKIAAQIKGN